MYVIVYKFYLMLIINAYFILVCLDFEDQHIQIIKLIEL
jgi:hypothetical protein